MPLFLLASVRGPSLARFSAGLPLVLVLMSLGGLAVGGSQPAQAQEATDPCADTLAAAEQAYRNRSYQEAVALASQCTDQEAVDDETAIRAWRVITLASLRQGALLQARSAVENILQIDPTYTADPVNDPPSYNLFVSMVRREVSPETTTEAGVDTTGETAPDTTAPTSAQPPPEPTRSGVFLKFGGGISDYTGDYPVQNVGHPFDFQEFVRGSGIPYVLQGEIGYQFSSGWALLLGFQFGNYPIVGYGGTNNTSDSDRFTPQLLIRYTFRDPDQTVRPYIDGGGNVTFGGEPVVGTGYGPSLGFGLSIALGRAASMYVESRFNATFPDDAIDDFASDGGGLDGSVPDPVDSVNQLLGVGLRVNFGG
ncbi:MAG: hypothetical protein ABEL04_03130 [Salinibacter sp.]|uniref:hypothetical protein n=1 Tax=Salinibacter sp. TaxID=2065818 RepID=UPI0035D51F09